MKRSPVLILSLIVSLAACASTSSSSRGASPAQPAAPASVDDALTARAKAIAALIVADPVVPADLFDDRMAPSAAKLGGFLKQFHTSFGAVRAVVPGERLPNDGQRFQLECEKGTRIPMRLYVENKTPFRIGGLWFDKPIEPTSSAEPGADANAPVEQVLRARADAIARAVSATPTLPAGTFDEKMSELLGQDLGVFKKLFTENGAVREVKWVEPLGESGGRFEFVFANSSVPVRIYLEDGGARRVAGLWFGATKQVVSSLDETVAALKQLPGRVSFAACKLGAAAAPAPQGKGITRMPPIDGRDITFVSTLNADQPLALGSTFKIYILGALMEQVRQGKRHWDDVVQLDDRYRSLPSGSLQKWPAKSPFTLETLAGLMISESDNTATDNLLFTVGREKVEAMLAPMGNRHPERNAPFLSTGEMFRLKSANSKEIADAYLARNIPARRQLVETELSKVSLASVSPRSSPYLVESVEWFASAADLCRALDWIRRGDGAMARGRDLMAINVPGVQEGQFEYAGYKGGSEPGVVNMSWLVKAKDGTWWAVSMGWNDDKAVDVSKLLRIGGGALGYIAAGAK